MAFNKAKALESALKFLNQGKVAQAIGEYQQILRHDAKDQATLMTVGDLFARQGDMPQAIEYFERLAQVYLNDGFNSKAIAIYKKIAKLAPNELQPLERLADLYVQQGVLSEARPLFLQIAEAHLKANHAPKAVEVLHRLLDVEPENPRVQMRLAELYNVMGQKKEAAQTYFNYAQRLFDHGDTDEAPKLIERALEVDPTNTAAQLLKGKILTAAHKEAEAIAVLEKHPEADAGGDVTNTLVELELKLGEVEKAADRARNQLVRGNAHFGLLMKVADSLIESGKAKEALPLLRELREPMTEANEQDKFLQALLKLTEKAPRDIEANEFLADFGRHTSDPFRVNSALNELVEAYADAGDFATAEERLKELIERNRGDERLIFRLEELRQRAEGGAAAPAAKAKAPAPAAAAPPKAAARPPAAPAAPEAESEPEEPRKLSTPVAQPVIAEEPLDEETQRYVSQALTDVDLFSSYGLTHKATHLLENVLQRAPRHTPTLERLLDFYLGAGDERRTAELAGQLEQIHRERQDTVNADRFAELRSRFEKAAEASGGKAAPAVQDSVSAEASVAPAASEPEPQPAPEIELVPTENVSLDEAAPAPAAAEPAEFEISLMSIEPEEPAPAGRPAQATQAAAPEPLDPPVAPEVEEAPAAAASSSDDEVDLSDEWEAIAREVTEPEPAAAQAAEEEPAPLVIEETGEDRIEIELPSEAELAEIPMEIQEAPSEPEPEPETQPASASVPEDPIVEIVEEQAAEAAPAETAAYGGAEFELELSADPKGSAGKHGAETTEDFLSELAAEVEDMETPMAAPPQAPPAKPSKIAAAPANGAPPPPAKPAALPVPAVAASAEHAKIESGVPAASAPNGADAVPAATIESLNELAEVFQEFRSELGELTDEDEDLETHYNLGIAYREMGLLDEAIGEFQKVAKAVQKGKPFAYAMNCATLLALSFIDKGEPKIASLWYQRALETPRLDQETVLALRYDLGVALDLAGESSAALDSFRQVYAMNIDYRDVADRIATLQKA